MVKGLREQGLGVFDASFLHQTCGQSCLEAIRTSLKRNGRQLLSNFEVENPKTQPLLLAIGRSTWLDSCSK